MAQATMVFPADFLWGTATSAHQVEGNNLNNDWWAWEEEVGHIAGAGRSGLAGNWWAAAEVDFDHAAEMGTNALRLSVEWSRIEPEPSVFDDDALGRYREMLQALRARGIEPLVTLHHFTNPLWLVAKGDFGSDLVVDYFRRYTAKVVAAIGDLVPRWITFHEPIVYLLYRYVYRCFPQPAAGGWPAAMRALRHVLACHAAAYRTIKAARPQAQVGVAKNYLQVKAPEDGNWLDRRWAGWLSGLANDLWLTAMATGRLRWPAGPAHVDHLAGAFDFVGLDYDTLWRASFPPRAGRLVETSAAATAAPGDGFPFELYPAGLFTAVKQVLPYGKPIYITAHGLPDAADRRRPGAILSHLRELWRAISFNFPVMGYYHRTLVDSFEWEQGWDPRFGLIALDLETQARTWRPSAFLYQEICRAGAISSDMAARYAPELLDTMFPGRAPEPLGPAGVTAAR
jgi:beta-glucosidase